MSDEFFSAGPGDLIVRAGDLPPDQRPAALRRLLDHDAARPDASEPASPVLPAREDDWSELERAAGTEFAAEPHATGFADLLGRMGSTADGMDTRTRPLLRARVDDVLAAVRGSADLRVNCFVLAEEALGECGDRVILGLDWIEDEIVDHRARSGELSHADVLDLGKRKFRQSVLNAIAVEKAAGVHDEIEVLLAYRVRFKDRLDLPGRTEAMLFPACAELSSTAMDEAVRAVASQENGPAMQRFLCDFPPWRAQLRRSHAQDFAERLADVNLEKDAWRELPEGMDAFDYAAKCKALRDREAAIDADLVHDLTRKAFDPPASA